MSVEVMFVYLPPHQGTHAGEFLATASAVPLWCVPRTVPSTDGAFIGVPSSEPVSSGAIDSAATSAASESSYLCTAAVPAADGVSSTAAVSDVTFPVASRAKIHSDDVREDRNIAVPADSFSQRQRMNVSLLTTAGLSSSASLLPPTTSHTASSDTGTSRSSTSVPAPFLVLQLPTETLDSFLPAELQTYLQTALTAARVHVSPYALQCLRRHVLRSQLASLRYFTPPLLPPVLLRSVDAPSIAHKRELRVVDGGRSFPVREQRFCVAPEVVVHLVFQSWKNYFFLPVDAAAAAVMGLIPSSPDDAIAAAALAAWNCVAAKTRHMSSVRQAPASHRYEEYGQCAASTLGSTASAAAAVNTAESGEIDDRVELPAEADAFLGGDTARRPARGIQSAAGTVTSTGMMPAALLARPLPLLLCPQEAALRALAYWSCLAELQELELQHHFVSAGEVGTQEGQRGSNSTVAYYSGKPLAAFSHDISGGIRLVQQLKQSFHSVMKTVLKRQQVALDQLRERQSREMEEVSGRREFTSFTSTAVMPAGDTPHVVSSPSERISAATPSSPLLSAGAAAPALRHAAPHTGAAVASPAAGHPEVSAGVATSAAACATTSAPRSEVIADEDSSVEEEKRLLTSAHRSAETCSASMQNRCESDVAPDIDSAKREIDDATSEGRVDRGQSPATEVTSHLETIHTHEGSQNFAGAGISRPAEDTKAASQRREKDATEREKVEALVLQHVSEFQLVEMHWQAESLLLRRQQLQDLKNITVDLVLLRRAARQGYLSSPLILPPLPSAFDGDVVQLLPKKVQSVTLQTGSPADTAGRNKLSSLTCTGSEEQKQGKNVPSGLLARIGNLQHRRGSAEKKLDTDEREEMRISPRTTSQSDLAQVEKPVVNPVLASPDDAEAQEVQRLLRMYLPARWGHNKGGSASAETETAIRNQQLLQGCRSEISNQTSTIDAVPRPSQAGQTEYFTHGDLQRRPVTFIESKRKVPSVQPKMWHPQLPSSLREPLPAPLQLVTPTKLLRGFLHHQQQRRQTADERRQLETCVPQGGGQTCSSEAYHPEKGYEGRRPQHGGATDIPKNTGSSFFHRSTRTLFDKSVFSKGTETTRSTKKVKYSDLIELEAWEETVKSWPEEGAVEQLQQHAFLPLIFGKQRKRSAIIRICSGNITDVTACDPENNGTCQNNYCDSGSHVSSGGRSTDAVPMSATGTFEGFLTAKSAGGLYNAQRTWEDYDYCSDLAAAPPACSDKLFSKVLMSYESECCSHCTALSGNVSTGSKQPSKLCLPVHFSKRQTLTGAVDGSDAGTGAARHDTRKSRSSTPQIMSVSSETAERDAGAGICRLHTTPVADRTGVGAPAAPMGDSSRREQFAKTWLVTGGCPRANTAPENWIYRETPYVAQSERSHSRCSSFPAPMLAPTGADLELGGLGIVLPVGSSLKLTAPSHLRWESRVSDTTDFVFPSLDEQRQMLYRTLLHDQHYEMLLRARIRVELDAWRKRGSVCEEAVGEATRTRSYDTSADGYSVHSLSSLYRCAPSRCAPRLRLGDVFISRHSNSGPVNAVFHLVVHEEKDPDEVVVRGEQLSSRAGPIKAHGKEAIPLCVLQGVGEVLRISSTEGLRTLVLPLLLLEGEAAICSLTYAQLQQRAFQVVRYVINEIKDIYQNSSDAPNLRQIVLVLPPMPTNTATARAIPLKRANSKRDATDTERRFMTVTVSDKVENNLDSSSTDSAGCDRCTDGGTINGSVRQDRQGARQQHPTTALRKPLPVDSWMEAVLNLVISHVRNCGHCWVGKQKPRSLHNVPHT